MKFPIQVSRESIQVKLNRETFKRFLKSLIEDVFPEFKRRKRSEYDDYIDLSKYLSSNNFLNDRKLKKDIRFCCRQVLICNFVASYITMFVVMVVLLSVIVYMLFNINSILSKANSLNHSPIFLSDLGMHIYWVAWGLYMLPTRLLISSEDRNKKPHKSNQYSPISQFAREAFSMLIYVVSTLLISFVFIWYVLHFGGNYWIRSVNSIIFFLSIISILMVVWVIWILYFSNFIRRLCMRTIPQSYVIYHLLLVLYNVETQKQNWAKLHLKRRVLSNLEEASICIEKYIPDTLTSGDPSTDFWFASETTQIAASIRLLKKWILNPRPDTRDLFLTKIAGLLTHIIQGDWDKLERVEPEKVSYTNILRQQVLSRLNVLVIGYLPARGFALFQKTPIAMTGGISSNVRSIIFAWAALHTIMAFSPTYQSTLTHLKEVVTLLTNKGSKD